MHDDILQCTVLNRRKTFTIAVEQCRCSSYPSIVSKVAVICIKWWTVSCLHFSIAIKKVVCAHWVLYIEVHQHGRHKMDVHGKLRHMKLLYCPFLLWQYLAWELLRFITQCFKPALQFNQAFYKISICFISLLQYGLYQLCRVHFLHTCTAHASSKYHSLLNIALPWFCYVKMAVCAYTSLVLLIVSCSGYSHSSSHHLHWLAWMHIQWLRCLLSNEEMDFSGFLLIFSNTANVCQTMKLM